MRFLWLLDRVLMQYRIRDAAIPGYWSSDPHFVISSIYVLLSGTKGLTELKVFIVIGFIGAGLFSGWLFCVAERTACHSLMLILLPGTPLLLRQRSNSHGGTKHLPQLPSWDSFVYAQDELITNTGGSNRKSAHGRGIWKSGLLSCEYIPPANN